jgi:ligand-binding sensor domain-containing protein
MMTRRSVLHILAALLLVGQALPITARELGPSPAGSMAARDESVSAPPAIPQPDQPAAGVTPSLPNHVVTALNPDTNPTVTLGEWKVYDPSNSTILPYHISSVALDSLGRPWVGFRAYSYPGIPVTGGGLSVHDSGANWTNYLSPTLVNNWVTAVAVDGRDQVWVGSASYYDSGLSSFIPGGVALRQTNGAWTHYVIGSDVTAIAAAGTEVWIGRRGGGIARMDASTNPPTPLGAFTTGSTGGGLASDNINTIAIASHDDLFCGRQPRFWVGHASGVSVYGYGIVSIMPITCGWAWTSYGVGLGHPLPAASITAITVDARNRVWFGSDCCDYDPSVSANGLTVLDGNSWITYTVNNSGLTYNRIRSLAADRQGRVWIGQTDLIIDIGRPEPESAFPDSLPPKVALNVFDEGTWCHYEVGGGSCQNPVPPAGLPSNYVTAIAASQERVWIGTLGGIATLTLDWKTFDVLNSALSSNDVHALWLDSSPGRAWVGAPGGVDRYDGTTWQHYPLGVGGSCVTARTSALHRDSAGRLWAGQSRAGAACARNIVWQYFAASDGWGGFVVPGPGDIMSLSSDLTTNKRLWVGTYGGGAKVFNVTSSSWVSLTTSNSPIVSNYVNAIARDTAGRMWLGTDQGISIYTGNGWITHTTASTGGGLIGNTVLALAEDGLGRMWIGTDLGVSVVGGTSWTTYTVESTGGGLAFNPVTAIAVDSANRIWFGTVNGASVFDGSAWTRLTSLNSGLADDYARAVAADNDGGAWFGTGVGLSVRGTLPGPIGLPAPTIAGFAPASGAVNTLVTINGANFYFGSVDTNRVLFTGPSGTYAEATIVSRGGTPAASSLTVRVPFNAVKGPLYVSHGGGVAQTSSDFTPVPTYTSYAPTAAGAGFDLVVLGANLGGASRIRFSNGAEATNLEPLASNRLRIKIPANASSGPLTLITDSGSVVLSPPFTFAALCPQKPDKSCAGPGDGGAIEVNQGLPDDMYPLVAGKETLVRVYVGSSVPNAFVAIDSATLTVIGPSGMVFRSAVIPARVFNHTVRNFSELRNVNFYLDGSEIPTSGDYEFVVDVRAGGASVYSASVVKTIERTKDVRLLAVIWYERGASGGVKAGLSTTDTVSLQKAMATLGRVLPVRRGVGPVEVDRSRGLRWEATLRHIPLEYFTTGTPRSVPVICDKNTGYKGFDYVVGAMEGERSWYNGWLARQGAADRFDDSAGFISLDLNPIFLDGCANMGSPGSIARGNMNALIGDATGAVVSQELAHNFGLVQDASPTSDKGGHSVNELVLAPSGTVTESRSFNLATRRAITQPHTVMQGSCCNGIESNDTQLFEPVDYAPLMQSIRSLNSTGTGVVASSLTTASQVFNLIGVMDATGIVTRSDSYLLPAGAEVTPLSTGPYYLAFLDASQHVLALDGFPVSFIHTHGGEGGATVFRVSRPMPDGAAHVQVRRNSTSLVTYTISANTPAVTLTLPTGGSFGASEGITTTWTASDADGDPLTFALSYSGDDGVTWQVIESGVTEASLVWNTALVRGTATGSFSRVRVVASDGFNTAEAISARFTVAGKPPIVTITAPQTPTAYVEGQLIRLEGLATDLEDGLLSPASLQWSSDRDGSLGAGETTSAMLTVGTHLIALRGTDRHGNVVTDTLAVTIESDFDGDGIPDAGESDNFWNPEDAGSLTGGVTKLDRSRGVTSPSTGTPGLSVSPSDLDLIAERGAAGPAGIVIIQSTNLISVSWTATKTQPWLSLSATSGSTLAAVEVMADASGLCDGIYTDVIRVQAGSFQKNVTVRLTVVSRSLIRNVYLPVISR